jgi:hypothetical protein
MTTYALYAIRTSPSTIAVTPKTSVSTSNSIQSKLRQSPLLKLIREAHEGTDQESSSTDNVLPFSMNHSYVVGEDEGQQDDNLDYNQNHSDDEEDYPHSQNDSYSDAERTHESRDHVGSDNDSDASSHHSDTSAPYWQSTEEIGDSNVEKVEVHFSNHYYLLLANLPTLKSKVAVNR